MKSPSTLEKIERLVWNLTATVCGYALAPYSLEFCRNKPRLANWHWHSRNELNLDIATALINFLGLGEVHKKRISNITQRIFS